MNEKQIIKTKVNAQLTNRHSLFASATNRPPVRYVRARSTANNSWLLLMLCNFFGAVAAYRGYVFKVRHESEDYQYFAVEGKNSQDADFDTIKSVFLSVYNETLGECGPFYPTEAQVFDDLIFMEELCGGSITFKGITKQKMNSAFEACIRNISDSFIGPARQECNDRDAAAEADQADLIRRWSIIIGSAIGFIILASIVICIIKNINCARRNYEEIPAPDVKPPRKARQAQTEAKDPELGKVNASNDEYELPDSRRDLKK